MILGYPLKSVYHLELVADEKFGTVFIDDKMYRPCITAINGQHLGMDFESMITFEAISRTREYHESKKAFPRKTMARLDYRNDDDYKITTRIIL